MKGLKMHYSEEELKKSVYYPASWLDVRPIFEFYKETNFFIYVDWMPIYWSETKADYVKRKSAEMRETLCKIEEAERPRVVQPVKTNTFDKIFQPMTAKEYRHIMENQIQEVEADPRDDWGLRGKIIEEMAKSNEQGDYDLALVDDGRFIPLEEIGLGDAPQWPDGLQLEPAERERYERMSQENTLRWAREFTISNREQQLKMLYICAEGLTAYFGLFKSGAIAPKILVLTNSFGPGANGWGDLREIFEHVLKFCQERPSKIWP